MKNKKPLQIILPLVVFLVLTITYLSPLLEGKIISGSDLVQYAGMSKEISDYRAETGNEALWTNGLFSGMPSYLIAVKYPGNLFDIIIQTIHKLPKPMGHFLLNFSLFFLLLMLLRINPWVSMAGAIAFGFNSAFFVWVDTGHITKAHTITYMALVVAGVLYAYNHKRLIGALLAGLGFNFMIYANHPQMTYYTGLMVAIIGLTYLVYAFKEKTIVPFLKTSLILVLFAALAVGANFSRLYTVYEYGKFSMRGASELSPKTDDQTKGLDKSYILDYSYDLGEAFTAFIPRFKGGGMSEPLGENSNFYKELEKTQGKARAKQIAQQAPLYWGSQPISGAPFYYGAVLCFLFVLGLFLVKGKEKWWIAATVLVALLLSLGKNIPALAHFMIDYFPGYNKFRDVKNIISIQQFAMALMGALVIKEIYLRTYTDKALFKKLKWAFGITGGFALLFGIIPGLAGDFIGKSDAQMTQMGWPQNLIDALQADRKAVLRADAFRAFFFVTIAAAAIWAYVTQKLKAQYAIAIWVLLVVADMWPVNKRYFNNDDFVAKRKAETPFTPNAANQFILKDTDPNYRVLNMAVSTFNDASTSYFHKSIGGYHGAKMQRYQELIENHIAPEMQQIGARLRKVQSEADLATLFKGMNAINMLNTRYLIYDPNAQAIKNLSALGNAWFVEGLQWAENADDEIETLNKIDVSKVAVADKRFSSMVGEQFGSDSLSNIELLSYDPNKLVYRSSSNAKQLAVFSEIYYPKGWQASIDGTPVEHIRVNYVLRALEIPAGQHDIVFEFKPKSYYMGNIIAMASSVLMLLLFAGIIFFEMRNCKTKVKNEE
ncbi:MAG: YfhO family protein [Prolixibacteraceae bacterium]|nr:YfhO family protein [Prolixibacteraceae bacterium]